MQVRPSHQFIEDFEKLKREGDRKILGKLLELIMEAINNIDSPLQGIGKPEFLKGNLRGFMSRRITDKHRLIYKYEGGQVLLVSCYGHYSEH